MNKRNGEKMNKKSLIYRMSFFMCLLGLLVISKQAQATSLDIDVVNKENQLLVVYDSRNGMIDEEHRMLDMVLGHFAETIEFVNSKELENSNIEGKTHLIYFGRDEEELSDSTIEIIGSFTGGKLGIGYNVDQLGGSFSFVDLGDEQSIDELSYLNDPDKTQKIEAESIIEVTIDENVEVLSKGKGKAGEFPFIMHQGNTFYMATDSLFPPNSIYLAEILNKMFEVETTEATPAYIRLEDVHPLSDPENLMAIAKELKQRNIPYMVATIPVYTDPKTKIEYHFEDFPEVLEALKYMQENGGSIVLHGYTHQYRGSETGEGFEFWDTENQSPIYSGPDEKFTKISALDFDSQEEYLAAVDEQHSFETDYIKTRLTKGVQELANYGLYPLAFEAPHYTMSQNGYAVTSEIFSTYVGQIQLSDEEWQIMNTAPYASKPSFLNGMLLLPETIGYVDPNLKEPVKEMMNASNLYQVADNGIIGGFYHPYLGVDGFKSLMDEMEKIPNLEWIDLKEIPNTVNVENVSITSKNGEVTAKVDYIGLMKTSFRYPNYYLHIGLDKVIWFMVYLGVTFIAVLVVFIVVQKINEKRFRGRIKS